MDAADLVPIIGLSVRTIRRLQGLGMPCVRVGRRVLFRPEEVVEWLARGSRPSAPAHRVGRPRRVG